jgi:hypothetical protein
VSFTAAFPLSLSDLEQSKAARSTYPHDVAPLLSSTAAHIAELKALIRAILRGSF